jgi:hypothetical protein
MGSAAVIDLWPIVEALEDRAPSLAASTLRSDAPPAFLLDANRRASRRATAGMFDNRSVCTALDFPTGDELATHGIEHVVVLREAVGASLARDLTTVLVGFQDRGLKIHEAASNSREPVPMRVSKPSVFARLSETLYRWSLSRNDEGAFGHAHVS